jgi:asparagine synthase (glutamine-hydrolysing)
MVGIVGYTKFKNSSLKARIERMVAAIKSDINQRVECFFNDFLDTALVAYPNMGFSAHAINENGSIGALVYGKIFGFEQKLRLLEHSGHEFNDAGNMAEFVVHAYEEWGKTFFCDLNGSFCLVLFDVKIPEVLLVTDRFGTRPIYYAFKNGDVIFASHARAILEYPFPRRLNLRTLVKFLYYGKIGILGDETWFEGIKLIPLASVLVSTKSGHTLEKYWDLVYSAGLTDEEEIVKALVKAFRKAVNLRIDGLDGVSVMLSGGLDSRCVLGAVEGPHKVSAVTFGIKGCDDIAVARKVTKRLGVKHLTIEYNPDELVGFARDVVFLTDGQGTVNVSYIPFVAKKMRESGIKYYLQGYMLDLLLGGSYLSKESFKAKDYADLLTAMERRFSLFQASELRQILTKKYHGYIAAAKKEFIKLVMGAKGDSFPNKIDYFAINTRVRRYTLMGSILHREFVEELLPTIDNDVIEIIRYIPPELRFNYHIYRKFLLALNPELAKVPYQKTLLLPIVPFQLWHPSTLVLGAIKRLSRDAFRYKHSYFEFNEILRRHANWGKLVRETLMSENSLVYKLAILNRDYVTKLVNDHFKRRKNNGEKIAFLITIELLLRTFFKNQK